jgi:NAD(P)-dependent dehydrogenase (short-subunit alcohol dehydrogenase family)
MAIDLASYGITVNAVGPGACETPALAVQMTSGRIAEHDLERTPLGRWGTPADIAAAVRFLARDATWMTGQTIYVDGGYLAAGLPMFPEIAGDQRALPTA